MSAKNTTHSFGFVAKSFHWVIAGLIILMLAFGYFMEDFPAALEGYVYNTHKTIGIIILTLMVIRLGWRWCNVQPAYSAKYPVFVRFLAHAAHYAIYLVVIAMPLSGWVMSTASGKVPHFLGWFYFPMPGIPLDPQLAGQAYQLHNLLAIVLIVLLSLHLVAALFHHFVLGDNVLKRMLPNRKNYKE